MKNKIDRQRGEAKSSEKMRERKVLRVRPRVKRKRVIKKKESTKEERENEIEFLCRRG